VTSFDLSYLLPFDGIAKHYVGLGDQVYALGYPRGIADAHTSRPIAKSGYIANIPGEPIAIELPANNRVGAPAMIRVEGKLLRVDGLLVGGNSGGPGVLPYELKVRRDPQTNQLQFADKQQKNLVVGIVSSGFGDSGLTLVFASDYIIELITDFTEVARAQWAKISCV
jgi:hypothetical protein